MSYALPEDFIEAYGLQEAIELSNLENPIADSPDLRQIANAIAHANSEINSYLGVRYLVPIAPPFPLILVSHTLSLARYRLDRFRRREDVTKDYELAIASLKDMAIGRMALSRPDSSLVAIKSSNQDNAFGDVSFTAPEPIWTREKLQNYQRYPDR